jgi:cell division topological specificity factor
MTTIIDRLLGRARKGSGKTAKERLQLVLITDRTNLPPERLMQMKEEIIAVIAKYVNVSPDRVVINVEQRERDNWLVADIPLLRELSPDINGPDDA